MKTDNIRCWDCHGRHKRSECTADKKSLYCKRCRVNGHSYEACRRGRRATRSPSQSGYTTRSSAPSPASTSSEKSELSSIMFTVSRTFLFVFGVRPALPRVLLLDLLRLADVVWLDARFCR